MKTYKIQLFIRRCPLPEVHNVNSNHKLMSERLPGNVGKSGQSTGETDRAKQNGRKQTTGEWNEQNKNKTTT